MIICVQPLPPHTHRHTHVYLQGGRTVYSLIVKEIKKKKFCSFPAVCSESVGFVEQVPYCISSTLYQAFIWLKLAVRVRGHGRRRACTLCLQTFWLHVVDLDILSIIIIIIIFDYYQTPNWS